LCHSEKYFTRVICRRYLYLNIELDYKSIFKRHGRERGELIVHKGIELTKMTKAPG